MYMGKATIPSANTVPEPRVGQGRHAMGIACRTFVLKAIPDSWRFTPGVVYLLLGFCYLSRGRAARDALSWRGVVVLRY